MKKIYYVLIACAVLAYSCKNNDNENEPVQQTDTSFSLNNGSIIINNQPNIKIKTLNRIPEGVSTLLSKGGRGLKSLKADEQSGNNITGNNYRFSLIGEQEERLKIDGVEVQATHVKIEQVNSNRYYAYVTYNEKGDGHHGAIVVFKVDVTGSKLEEIDANITAISVVGLPNAELSAIDVYNNKLYFTGASEDPEFNYNEDTDGYNYAFFGVLELNADKTIAKEDAVINKLTSFQGTSIRVSNNQVYITTGDGTEGTQGGLFIYDASGNTLIKSVLDKDHARSVDVDADNIYLLQAEPARITRYNLNGENSSEIYSANEATQRDAKSELLAWNNYLLVAENESGLRMLDKTGNVVDQLDRPGDDPEKHVTNSVAINDSKKKDADGKEISSNLLLLANGEKGIYWYDILKVNDKDQIVLCNGNSILEQEGNSANFITSTGNIVFLADGLGGLKILYIGFAGGSTPPVVDKKACNDFMPYLLSAGETQGLLPEGESVFRSTADPIIKTLFANESASSIPDYIEILEDTELHISFIWEGAGWFNALGFFVIPTGTTLSDYDYYNTVIKPDLCTTVRKVNVLKDKYTIFQNVSMVNDPVGTSGSLVPNTTYKIGNYNWSDKRFKAGDKVILFMVPNGWYAQNNRVEVRFDNKNGNWPQIFFMNKGLNSKTKATAGESFPQAYKGVPYNMFYSMSCHNLVMIIEDQSNWSDLDYNDIIFTISDGTTETSHLEQPRFKVGLNESGELVITE